MTDDIVDRLRGHWRAAGQGCTHLCLMCTAADEIERLRAELNAWRRATTGAERLLDRVRSEAVGAELDARRLQSLIDAWTAASLSWRSGEPMPDALIAAEHALYAAATLRTTDGGPSERSEQEDDRG